MSSSTPTMSKPRDESQAVAHVECSASAPDTAAEFDGLENVNDFTDAGSSGRGCMPTWVKRHPWLAGAGVLLILSAIILPAVLLPVCLIKGCPPKSSSSQADKQPLRLILSFENAKANVLDMLPAQLRPFANNLLLDTSGLQLLTLSNEAILQEVRAQLQQRPDLKLLIRDFAMTLGDRQTQQKAKPQLISSATAAAGAESLLRQMAQRQSGRADSAAVQEDELTGGWQRQLSADAPQQWALTQADVDDAWTVTRGQDSIVVAVLDTGIDLTHPDLKDRIWINTREIPGNGIDDDNNGYVDDVNGINLLGTCKEDMYDQYGYCMQCGPSPDVQDAEGHGTHVSGIVAALKDASNNVAGVAPNVKIMPLKVADCIDNSIYASAVFSALDYALRMGAHMVSCSFSTPYMNGFTPQQDARPDDQAQQNSYQQAIAPLQQAGVLVLAAAGNNQLDLDRLYSYHYANNPCFASLDNVICIGATAESGEVAEYSNYGKQTVHIAAPGTLKSTWLDGTFHTLYGTSMATPVVTGTSALVLSLLGQLTGSYTGQAARVRQILLDSADAVQPATPGTPANITRRLNSAKAIKLTLSSYAPAGMATVTPWPAPASQPPVAVAGLSERYYSGSAAGAWQSGPVVDSSVRSAVLPLSTFKYGAGYTLRLSAASNLMLPGIYNIRITAANALLLVNGATTAMRAVPGGQQAVFWAKAPGAYSFDFIVPNPSGSVDILVQSPDKGAFMRMTDLTTYGYGAALQLAAAPKFTTAASGFSVYYTASTSEPAKNLLHTFSMGTVRWLKQAAATSSLSYAPGALRTLLFPSTPSSTQAGALGIAVGTLQAPSGTSQYQFRVACKRCMLLLNEQMLVDNWESGSIAGGATKQSGCVTLVPGSTNTLAVRFATPDLKDAPLFLQWAACGSAPTWAPVTSASSTLWWPSQGLTGYIGGMQCDVWKGTSVPWSVASPPTYKARLPMAAAGSTERINATTATPISLTLDAMLPGLASAFPASGSQRFSVRCWTYTATSFSGALALGGKGIRGVVLLGDVQVWSSNGVNVSPAPLPAPTFSGNGALRFLAAEWQNVTSTTLLQLLDGSSIISASLVNMRLPLPVLRTADAAFVGPKGHWSQAFGAPAPIDAPGVIQYSMAELPRLGSYSNAAVGLNVAVSTGNYSGVKTSVPHYALAAGYLAAPGARNGPALNHLSLRVTDPSKQGVMLVAGGAVTLRNGPPFGPRAVSSSAAVPSTTELYLPPGSFLRAEVVIKSVSPVAASGGAWFAVSMASPPTAPTQWLGPSQWLAAVNKSQGQVQ